MREEDSIRNMIDDNASDAQMMKNYDILSLTGVPANANLSMVPIKPTDVSSFY